MKMLNQTIYINIGKILSNQIRFWIFAAFVCSALFSFAQVSKPKTPSQDSIKNAVNSQVDERKTQFNNGVADKKDELKEKRQSLTTETKAKKDSIKSQASEKVATLKDTFGSFRDSLLQFSFKDVLSDYKPNTNTDSLKGNLKAKLKGVKSGVTSSVSLSGEIVSESFTTNYRDPFTVSEMTYSRFYGSPTLQIANLPFKVDFFVTTEDNTIYNSNTFSARFDTEQFKNNLRQKANQKLQDVTKHKDIISNKKEALNQQRGKLKQRLESEKQKLNAIELDIPKVDVDAKGQIPNTPDVKGKSSVLKDKLKSQGENKIEQLKTEATNKKDSFVTANTSKDRITSMDSAKYEEFKRKKAEYEKRKAQYDNLMKKYELVDSVYTVLKSADSLYEEKVKKLRSEYANQDFLKQQAQSKLKSKKLASLLSKIDYFELGINYPYFSKLSLNGTPVKGLNIGFSSGKNRYKIVAGKTFNNQFNTFGLNQPNPEFTRNVQGVSFEHQTARGSIEIANSSIWDNATEEEPKRNFVQTISLDHQFGKKIVLKLHTAHSVYSDNTSIPPLADEIDNPSFLEQRLNQLALGSELRFRLDAQSKLKVEAQRIYPGFINLSNPYMRNGFDEYKANLDRKFFKRKLHTTIFYKHFSDNITGIQQSTNTMKGYGISARTNFRKLPNFFVQHAPYEQGNNHPDSIFRTNNQLSVTSAGMIYLKQVKKTNVSVITNYTRSQIDFNNGESPVENVFYNAMVGLKRPKLNLSINGYRNQSKPNIDTLNYSGARIELAQQGGAKVLFSSSLFYDYYDSDDYRYNWVTTAAFTFRKKLSIQTSFGLGMVDGLYGVDHKNIYSGRLLLTYRL